MRITSQKLIGNYLQYTKTKKLKKRSVGPAAVQAPTISHQICQRTHKNVGVW